jgi:hypothetical protein
VSAHVTQRHAELLVESPYDERFVEGAKRLGSRWDPSARVWSIPMQQRAQLRALLLDVYKTDAGLPDEPPPTPPRPATALPTAADVERIVAAYTIPQVGSRDGAGPGPFGSAAPA